MTHRLKLHMRRFVREESGSVETVAFALWMPMIVLILLPSCEAGSSFNICFLTRLNLTLMLLFRFWPKKRSSLSYINRLLCRFIPVVDSILIH